MQIVLRFLLLLLCTTSFTPQRAFFLNPQQCIPRLHTTSSSDDATVDSPAVVWSEVFRRDFATLYRLPPPTAFDDDDDECGVLDEAECSQLEGVEKLARRLNKALRSGGGGRERPGVFRGIWRETLKGEEEEAPKQFPSKLKNIAATRVGINNFYSYVTSKSDLEFMEGLVEMGLGTVKKMGEEQMGKGEELLRKMKRKVSKKSAFDTLVLLSIWSPHECLPLLSLSYAIHPSPKILSAVNEAISNPTPDVDSDLGIRRDLRRTKCYTIDAGGSEIDDAVGVEVFNDEDGNIRRKYWIHIADAERWCFGCNPDLLEHAKERGSSIYLPTGSIGMFPRTMQSAMSLVAGRNTPALSMSLEIGENGEIVQDSIELAPSTIHVDYKLTYEDVDEMLAEGVGYREEWELGVLLQAAKLRRMYRIGRNATESLIDSPVPQGRIDVWMDRLCEQGVKVEVSCEEASYNAGLNGTAMGSGVIDVSDGRVLVTEMMIMAGEAMGKWCAERDIKVAYRNQPKPRFIERQVEYNFYKEMRKNDVGNGWPASWYVRRFMEPVEVGEERKGHAGLGLDEYVQWSSPIRRFSDLQVHATVKRHLRLKSIMDSTSPLPPSVTATDLGVHLSGVNDDVRGDLHDINWMDGRRGTGEGKRVMKEVSKYWMLEHLRREDKVYTATVLGNVPNVNQPKLPAYAVLIEDIGFETVYKSEAGELKVGARIRLRASEVDPKEMKVVWRMAS